LIINIAGYQDISLIDVHGYVSSVLWVCGCNLKCPYCHNWRIAIGDPSICKPVDTGEVKEEITRTRRYVDYLHVTGGEPLLQHRALEEIYEFAHEVKLLNSLNSNLVLTENLRILLDKELIDHIATDLRAPFSIMSGVESSWSTYWEKFVESLRLIADHGIRLELRIPVARSLTNKYLGKTLEELLPVLSRIENIYCIVNPLVGPPHTQPRDREWSAKYCFPSEEELEEARATVEAVLGCKVFVKKWW